MNEWMNEKKSFSEFAQKFSRWSSGGVNLFVFRKIVTSFFQIGKKSDLVLKFENFRSKTRARRDLFFHEVWLLDQKHGREEAFFFHEFWILVQKHQRGEAFFSWYLNSPPASLARAAINSNPASLARAAINSNPASLARAVKKKKKKRKYEKRKNKKEKEQRTGKAFRTI